MLSGKFLKYSDGRSQVPQANISIQIPGKEYPPQQMEWHSCLYKKQYGVVVKWPVFGGIMVSNHDYCLLNFSVLQFSH